MKLYSIFESIDGEINGWHQGCISTFIRFAGCNLRCSYCDTIKAQKEDDGNNYILPDVVRDIRTKKITLTGGEPLLQYTEAIPLVEHLIRQGRVISIETNGRYNHLRKEFYLHDYEKVQFISDYKLPGSGEFTEHFDVSFGSLQEYDIIKFVVGTQEDLLIAIQKIIQFKQTIAVKTYAISPIVDRRTGPVFDAKELVDHLIRNGLSDVVLNFQLHKLLNLKEEEN